MDSHKLNAYLFHILADDFASPDAATRKKALYAIGRLGKGVEVLGKIRELANHDIDAEVRYAAKKALDYWNSTLSAQKDGFHVSIPLSNDGKLELDGFAKLLSSSDAGTQISIIMEAVRLGDPHVLPLIIDRAEIEDDPWVLSLLIKAIGTFGDTDCVTLLSRFLAHENSRVVANSVDALDMIGDPDAATLVLPLLNSDDNRVRANAVRMVYKYDEQASLRTLKVMVSSKKEWMRDSALYCLRILDSEWCHELLITMLKDEPSEDLFIKICRVFSEKGGRQALPLLSRLSLGGTPQAIAAEQALTSIAEREGISLEEAREDRTRDASRASQAIPALLVEELRDELRSEVPRSFTEESGLHRAISHEGKAVGTSIFKMKLLRGVTLKTFLGSKFLLGLPFVVLFLFLLAWGLSGGAEQRSSLQSNSAVAKAALLVKVATSSSPKTYVGRIVTWEGQVVTQQSSKVWVLRNGKYHFSVTFSEEPGSIDSGGRMRVTGKVTGRSLFGVVFVKAAKWSFLY